MDHLSTDDRLKVRDVYEGIVNADWFNRNAITERELFILIAGKVRTEVATNFSEDCLAEAFQRFSK